MSQPLSVAAALVAAGILSCAPAARAVSLGISGG